MPEARRRRPALRALLWKEWRQLRLLRGVGAVLCVVLPALLLVGAALRRQFLSFGSTFSYSLREIVIDLVPPVMATAWGVLALFVVAQSFAAERAAGTEMFLLASPVRRRWVFGTRLAAAFGTLATIVASGLIAWALWLLAAAGAAGFGSGGHVVLIGAGAGGIVLAAVSGTLAAALVPLPLPAVLTGLLLAVLPLGLSTVWGNAFPFATIDRFPLGSLLPFLLVPAYAVASFRALCTGEPAGGGRLRRACWTLALSMAGIVVLFVALAPLTIAQSASYRMGQLNPSPTGALALVEGHLAPAWLVDTSIPAGRPIRRFGPRCWNAWWSPDGRRLAVAREGGPLGMREPLRIEIYDTELRRTEHTLSAGDLGLDWASQAAWTGTHLVVAGWDEEHRQRLGAVRLADGRADPLAPAPALLDSGPWALLGPAADGRLYLAVAVTAPDRDAARRSSLRLHALDVERGILSEGPELEQEAADRRGWDRLDAYGLAWRLSPSGRYWVESRPGARESLRVRDLHSGGESEIDATRIGRVAWLAGDTLVWGDYGEDRSRLRLWSPATGIGDLLVTGAGQGFFFEASPDAHALLVREIAGGGPARARRPARVWDVRSREWTDVGSLVEGQPGAAWAGPGVLTSWGEQGLEYHRLP